ncbi:MAG TPA: DUF2933 domain-containing protein [Anaerolineae bacterium]
MKTKHLLIMLACCLVPLAALAAITVFNIPANTMIYFGILLLCPLLHFAMMRNMGHEHHGHSAHSLAAHESRLAAGDPKEAAKNE